MKAGISVDIKAGNRYLLSCIKFSQLVGLCLLLAACGNNLSVTRLGSGSGASGIVEANSDRQRINCPNPGGPPLCSVTLENGEQIVLRPRSGGSTLFGAWRVITPNTNNPSGFNWLGCGTPVYPPNTPPEPHDCGLTVNGNTTVFASFLNNSIAGSNLSLHANSLPLGAPPPIVITDPCPFTNCTHSLSPGFIGAARLAARSLRSNGQTFTFSRWSTNCTSINNGNICVVAIEGDTTVTAFYNRLFDLQVKLQGPGLGSIVSDPTGINCKSTDSENSPSCVTSFGENGIVTLRPDNDSAARFTGWTNTDCENSGTNPCRVTMNGVKTGAAAIVANFRRPRISVETAGPGSILGVDPVSVDVNSFCGPGYSIPRRLLHLASNSTGSIILPDDCSARIEIQSSTPPSSWEGSCSGTIGTVCSVELSQDASVTVNY